MRPSCSLRCAVPALPAVLWPPSHPQQVADHHRVGHHDEGLGAKLQLEHTAIVDEPAAMSIFNLELRGMCPSERADKYLAPRDLTAATCQAPCTATCRAMELGSC